MTNHEDVHRVLFLLAEMVAERDRRIAVLEEDNEALSQTLQDTEERAMAAELKLSQWEAAADVVGPVGRPR